MIEGFLAELTLRLFVSSPSDVAAERVRVKLVTDRLNAQLEGVVRLDVLRWEDAFYTAAQSFQQAIDGAIGNMSATDMVLCIVWKRAGLKLNPSIWRRTDGSPYESGTVLEFETAVEVSRKHKGVPDVYLFRKSAPVVYEADRVTEQLEQYQLLQAVWKRWTESTEGYNTAGYQSFADPDDFEIKLEACLRQWLERRGVVAQGPVWDRAVKGSPFRGLAAFEAAHSAVFFGREHAIARATTKLRAAPFLLLIGASGSGKSSLLRAGLLPRLTAARRACGRRPVADSAAQRGRRSDPRARPRAVRGQRAWRRAQGRRLFDPGAARGAARNWQARRRSRRSGPRSRAPPICGRRRCAMTRHGPQSS